MARQRRGGGRPANPAVRRTNLLLDPALKRWAVQRARAEGTPLHQVIEAALRALKSQL